LGEAQPFFATADAARDALKHGQALVLDVSEGQVRDITAEYNAAMGIL